MKINIKTIKEYPFSWICIAIIWILCFCTPPHTPLDKITLIDKWTHIVMYAGTCFVIWTEYMKKHRTAGNDGCKIKRMDLFVLAWLAPTLMSGVIEIIQANCTGGRRSGDWADFMANAIGATLGVMAGFAVSQLARKWRKQRRKQ